jgi:hypothetical protein
LSSAEAPGCCHPPCSARAHFEKRRVRYPLSSVGPAWRHWSRLGAHTRMRQVRCPASSACRVIRPLGPRFRRRWLPGCAHWPRRFICDLHTGSHRLQTRASSQNDRGVTSKNRLSQSHSSGNSRALRRGDRQNCARAVARSRTKANATAPILCL